MFLFIIGILVIISGIVLAKLLAENAKESAIVISIASVIATVIILISCFSSVPTGYTGILTTFGRVENNTMDAGFHLKAPWQKIVKTNIQEQRKSFTFEAFSSDIQQVKISGSVNYSINKSKAVTLYRDVGVSYADTLIDPRLYENTKVVIGRYEAEGLIAKRDILSGEILRMIEADLNDYGINIISLSIEDIDFTDAFTNAVEAKQVATQNKLRAETEQEQATMEARAEAERKRIKAEADAEIQKIEAEAEAYKIKVQSDAEAEANAKIAESLSDKLIEYSYANRWDGKLPETYLGGESDVVPVIQTNTEE